MNKILAAAAPATLAAALIASPASATLTTFESFSGHVGLSSDGCGSTGPSCNLTINVPVGSTVVSAILYTSTYDGSAASDTGVLSNGANSVGVTYAALPANASDTGLVAGRDDVTSLVQSVVGSGSASPFTFNITESNTNGQDGEGLFVIYSNPTTIPGTQSVALVDGGAASSGDTTTVNFSQPLDPTQPGFVANLRVGDGFSYDMPPSSGCCGQESTITVDNGSGPQVLSNNVGNCDDADTYPTSCADGNLITVGADDDTPIGPNNAPAGDPTAMTNTHENFDISSLLAVGETSITLDTINASQDDNIFALAFTVTGNAGFNAPPPPAPDTGAPEPASLALLGAGLTALGFVRRKRA